MAGNITVLPPRRTGFQEFAEGASPYLQQAFQMMMQRQLQEQQRQKAYTEAEKMGLLSKTPYQQVPIQGGTAQVSPMQGIKIPTKYKYSLNQRPGMQTSMKIGEGGIPQFGMESIDIVKKEKEERTIKNQDLARANQLRREFIDRPEIKEFTTVKNKVSTMESLANSSNKEQSKLAIDQALITLFNKITDPNSVVRESEYERTPHNLSLANRFSGAVEKWKKGGAGLTDEDRQSLVFGAKIMTNELGKMYNERLSQYSDIAGAYGVEPGLVTTGTEQYSPYNLNQQPAQQLQGQPQSQGIDLRQQAIEELRRRGRI